MMGLLYVSRANGVQSQDTVASILKQARTHNPQLGITGLLVWGHGYYLQTIEGPVPAVRALYARICKDPRHHSLLIQWQDDIAERRFSRWTMGQVALAHLDSRLLRKHTGLDQFDPYAINGTVSMAWLEDVIAAGAVTGRA